MVGPLYDLLRRCTVRISITNGYGTGFFVAPGLILTCAHVIKDVPTDCVSLHAHWNNQKYTAHLKEMLPDLYPDLALLQINMTNHPCVYLHEEVHPFDLLYGYGYSDNYPNGDSATFECEGWSDERHPLLKLKKGEVRLGLSGTPLLNVRTGGVCGLVQSSRGAKSDLGGRAIPTQTVLRRFPAIAFQQQQFHQQEKLWSKCLFAQQSSHASREDLPLLTSPFSHPSTSLLSNQEAHTIVSDSNAIPNHLNTAVAREPNLSRGRNPSRDRERMLKKVQDFWIRDVLEQSLHGSSLITLSLQEHPEVVANPLRLVLQESERSTPSLPITTSIIQVYDNANGELLILGEPGAGKTILLLHLARELLKRASRDETHPMPVVFNLSSWAQRQQTLAEWLVEELHTKYHVSRKLGIQWVEQDQILPLLDGLDEMSSASRQLCVDSINIYQRSHGLISLVVCSRSTDYRVLTKPLQLQNAVTVQPLTKQQIEEYLLSAGEALAPARVAMQNDQILQELVVTPLMLSVLTRAYHGIAVEDLIGVDTLERRRRHVLTTYVQRVLQRRGTHSHYSSQQTMRWLTWLAKQMSQHSQTEFSIEWMQPDLLPDVRAYQFYRRTAVGLVVALVGSYIAMVADVSLYNFVGDLFNISIEHVVASSFFLILPIVGLIYGLVFGGLGWLIGGRRRTRPISTQPKTHLQSRINAALYFGIGFGVIFVLTNLFWVPYHFESQVSRVSYGIIGGLLGALFGGLVVPGKANIDPVEMLLWSHVSLRRRAFTMLTGWLLGGIVGALIVLVMNYPFIGFDRWLSPILIGAATEGTIGGGVGFLLSGLSRGGVEKQHYNTPNQGIRHSALNSISGFLVGLAIMGLGFLLPTWILATDSQKTTLLFYALFWGVPLSITISLIIALMNGGYACIQHAVLRIFLIHAGCIPWNYPKFLDYAAERVLLRKVGGGYIFIHRLLLDYFASLDNS